MAEPTFSLHLERQEFEGDILGRPVYRLTVLDSASAHFAAEIDALMRRWVIDDVGLCTCRIRSTDVHAQAVLEAVGFRPIERLIALARVLPPSMVPPEGIDKARPSDHAACLAIGRTAFTFDRFHTDPLFPKNAADGIKEAWTRNGLAGRADCCLVVRDAATPVGFVLCRLVAGAPAIDLIAVASGFQRRGHARRLVVAAMAHYAGGHSTISVATQASNLPALALYRSLDFVALDYEVTYHFIKRGPSPVGAASGRRSLSHAWISAGN